MVYKVELVPKVMKFLQTIPKTDKERIQEKLKQISENPRSEGVVKLTGKTPEQYRIRQGDYRIVFSIHDHILVVEVIEVNHRKDIYRK